MITIAGLNPKQRALCDIMWGLQEYAAVEAFIATLPRSERLECRTLIQMMLAAFVDEITQVDQAQDVLKQFTL